jgi:hypothetical protein
MRVDENQMLLTATTASNAPKSISETFRFEFLIISAFFEISDM